jgi:hypothetical protein
MQRRKRYQVLCLLCLGVLHLGERCSAGSAGQYITDAGGVERGCPVAVYEGSLSSDRFVQGEDARGRVEAKVHASGRIAGKRSPDRLEFRLAEEVAPTSLCDVAERT